MFHLTTLNRSAEVTQQEDDNFARAGTLGVVVASLMAILALLL